MNLKFFADHCVPNSIVNFLIDSGCEVLKLKDHIPTDSTDLEVISKAQEFHSILVSLNGDFSDIVSYPPSNYLGIIAIYLRNNPDNVPVLMERLLKLLKDEPNMSFYKGKLIISEIHRIRIRK